MTFADQEYPPIDCAKCGTPHLRCAAHSKKTGKPCGAPRMKGQRICRSHGGATKVARAAGLRRVAVEKAMADNQATIAHFANEGITDPMEQLAKLAAEALAMKNALAVRVNALSNVRYLSNEGGEQLRAEVALYERALDRSARFVEILAKSGFEEARVKLEVQKGQLIGYVLKRVLDQLELNEKQLSLVAAVVPNELRRIGMEKEN